MRKIKQDIRECNFLCSIKIILSDVYACLSEVDEIKIRGIEILMMELNSVKLCNGLCSRSSSPQALKAIGQILLIPALARYAYSTPAAEPQTMWSVSVV